MPADFEKWLSDELHTKLDPLNHAPASTHPWYRQLRMQSWGRPLSMLPVAAVRGLVVAGTVAALSTTGTFALAAAVTKSPNPVVWGQQVQSAVEGCKSDLTSGQLGGCVSDFAQTHGANPEVDQNKQGSQSPEPSQSGHPEGSSGSGDGEGDHGVSSPQSSPHTNGGTETPEPSQTEPSQTPEPSEGR